MKKKKERSDKTDYWNGISNLIGCIVLPRNQSKIVDNFVFWYFLAIYIFESNPRLNTATSSTIWDQILIVSFVYLKFLCWTLSSWMSRKMWKLCVKCNFLLLNLFSKVLAGLTLRLTAKFISYTGILEWANAYGEMNIF